MNSILITGCNRGIGLGLVKKLLVQTKKPEYLIATCRDVNKAEVSANVLSNCLIFIIKAHKNNNDKSTSYL